MKKFITCILMLSMCSTLVGCTTYGERVESVNDTSNEKSTFKEVEDNDLFRIIYDTDTKVMYSLSTGSYNFGNLTMLVNADGSPKLYKED